MDKNITKKSGSHRIPVVLPINPLIEMSWNSTLPIMHHMYPKNTFWGDPNRRGPPCSFLRHSLLVQCDEHSNEDAYNYGMESIMECEPLVTQEVFDEAKETCEEEFHPSKKIKKKSKKKNKKNKKTTNNNKNSQSDLEETDIDILNQNPLTVTLNANGNVGFQLVGFLRDGPNSSPQIYFKNIQDFIHYVGGLETVEKIVLGIGDMDDYYKFDSIVMDDLENNTQYVFLFFILYVFVCFCFFVFV